MFTGRYEPIPESGELNELSSSDMLSASLKVGHLSPYKVLPGMDKEKRQDLDSRVTALQMEAEGKREQGWGQKSANWLAEQVGALTNPLLLVGGELGGLGVKLASPAIKAFTGKYLPSQATALLSRPVGEIIGARAPNFATKQSIQSLSKSAAKGFAIGTGFSLPSEIANTYNPETDTFNIGKGIGASFEDGGVGLAMMSAPYLGGILWSKLFKGAIPHTEMPLPGEKTNLFDKSHIEKAVADGAITPEEGQWLYDYHFNGDTSQGLATRATEMLIKDGHPADAATNQVALKVMSSNDVANLQTSVADKLAASHLPEDVRDLYSRYVSHNAVDGMRGNPQSAVDGMNGVVNYIRRKLAKVPEEMINYHKIMRRLLPENVKQDNPFTQTKLYNAMKKEGKTGLTVPHQIERRLKQEEKIKRLKQQSKSHQKNFENTGKSRFAKLAKRSESKIKELEENYEPLLSHKEEIEHLREKLLPEGKVANNFKSKREYERLMDLTRVRNDARRLMHEVNLKHQYEIHEAYAQVLDTLTKMTRSEFGRLAKPESINDYLRERIATKVPEFENIEAKDLKEDIKISREKINRANEDTKTPEGREEIVKSMDEEIAESKAEQYKEEYAEVKAQYDEFKNSPTVFSNLVQCVLGAMNVKS